MSQMMAMEAMLLGVIVFVMECTGAVPGAFNMVSEAFNRMNGVFVGGR